MKRLIKSITPPYIWGILHGVRLKYFTDYSRKSYSQEGEDLILERFFFCKPTGFYVDVGAHHPRRFSNTYRLYCQGWMGINIDANPGSMEEFRRLRPRDINIEAAVANASEDLTFYVFNEPALNTFDKNLVANRVGGRISVVNEVKIVTAPLSQMLDRHLAPGTRIDLLTVDVEGFDYQVLESNDWDRYSPDYILVECLQATTLGEITADPVTQFLTARSYSVVAKTMNTVFFKLNSASSC